VDAIRNRLTDMDHPANHGPLPRASRWQEVALGCFGAEPAYRYPSPAVITLIETVAPERCAAALRRLPNYGEGGVPFSA
jgi:hypothetical protein